MDPILRLYPGSWRRRYAPEVAALFEDRPPDLRDRVNLLGGAIDAHLHPLTPPLWPVPAAAAGGIAWTFAGAVATGQPAPPDWPGYLQETLPVLVAAVPLLALAVLGASTRLGVRDPATIRLGRVVTIGASLAWTALLVGATANLVAGPPLAIAATATGAGTLLVGVSLVAAGDWRPGLALLVAALCLVVPVTWAQVGYGAAWTAAAVAQLRDPRPADPPAGLLR